jgi:cyclomaltodextrinase
MIDGADRLQVLAQPSNGDAPKGLIGLSLPIELDRLGGDVWSWKKRVTGRCLDCPPEASIALRVNNALIPAERDGDAFAALVPLEPGQNRVAAVLFHANGTSVETESTTYTVRLTPRPIARIAIRLRGDDVIFDATPSAPSEYDDAPIESWTWSFREGNPAALEVTDKLGAVLIASKPSVNGEYFVSLTINDAEGRTDAVAAYFVVENGEAKIVDPMTHRAAWIAGATVYGAIPSAYGEPGFKALAERIDELVDLGVAAIWLSPSNRTLPGDFGYSVTDYFDTRPDFGSKDDLRALVQAAHARGIRVLMDFVPNHSSIFHPYFEDLQEYGRRSPYYDFYDRDDNGHTTFYFHYVHLHNLNFDNPEVRAFMTEALAYWVREFDIDGFRVDVAWGIRERRPDFWAACNRELKRIKPDSLLIAEAGAHDAYYVQNGFDAAYDWTDQLGHWAWEGIFGGEGPIAEAMTRALTNDGNGYHPDSLILRFLNNNDTGPRFITTHGLGYYRVASAMLMTLPGIPCVYNGDEVGAEFLPYDKLEIDWTDHHGLRDHLKRLIALRAELPSLQSLEWTPVAAAPSEPLFAFLRHGKNGDPAILVVLNFSEEVLEARIDLPAGFAELAQASELTDFYTNQSLSFSGGDRFAIPMPAWGIRILQADRTF